MAAAKDKTNVSAMEHGFQHHAFLSYSSKDKELADKLQDRLERHGPPWHLRKLLPHLPANFYPIFRDKTSMKLDCLTAAIREGLESSKYLIVICTKNSAVPNEEGKHWGNEEIESFIRLKPENIHRIIPIIFRKKQTKATACLPPALRKDMQNAPEGTEERNILATDVCSKGFSHAYCDIVAKLTNLPPELVWNRHRRRMILHRSIAAAATTAAALIAAWWGWDYYSQHYSYYADYYESDTTPKGVTPLTEEQRAARKNYYRFTTHKWRLRKIEYCNTNGQPTEHEAFWDRPSCIDNFTYSSTSESPLQMTQRTHRNPAGNEHERLMYTHTCSPSDATEASTNAHPLAASIRHLAILKNIRTDTHTSSGNEAGIAGYRLSYSKDGRVCEIACVNANGQLTEHEDGWAIVEFEYDDNGAVNRKIYKNAQQVCHKNAQGYAMVSFTRENGNLRTVKFLDENERPCSSSNGVASILWEYNSDGTLRETIYRDANNAPLNR